MPQVLFVGGNTYFCALFSVIMKEVIISDETLRQAAQGGTASFLRAVTDVVKESVDGELTAETMQELNVHQVTLWAFDILREEVCEGGFVQLIHNGYGPFFFQNPFARLMKDWGLRDLSKMMYAARDLYHVHGEALVADCTDDEFMALYEQFPDFDDLDDEFVDREDEFAESVAHYVDAHIEDFVKVES